MNKPIKQSAVIAEQFRSYVECNVIPLQERSKRPRDREWNGLTAFLYQRHRETIAFARPDLAVARMGSSSVAPAVDSRAKSAVGSCCSAFAIAR